MVRSRGGILIAIFFCNCFFANGQGIEFIKGLSWELITEKAKKENKYIFVDAFATWCGPCKKMDKDVYTNSEVGAIVNENFISLKVQMDVTKMDSEQVKEWYAIAHDWMERYEITAFPSYLFFSPNGHIVYKDKGYKTPSEFIQLVKDARISSAQYYTLLQKYNDNELPIEDFGSLALAMNEIGDKNRALCIAKEYKELYLEKLSTESLCNREYIDFITSFYTLVNSRDRFFDLFLNYGERVDSIFGSGTSRRWVLYVVNKEELEAKLWHNGKPLVNDPKWDHLYNTIQQKYGTLYAKRLVEDSKLDFYKRTRNWNEFIRLQEEKMKVDPPVKGDGISSDQWLLNSDAWYVFLHCDDEEFLAKALNWVEIALEIDKPDVNAQLLDTRANLLYKLGRVKEAITQEEEAIKLLDEKAVKQGQPKGSWSKDYQAILNKMKNGTPTW